LKKGRDPNDPGMGGKIPAEINSMAQKVSNQMDKGRREEHQVFS
jgi:hypothetical protein